MTTKLEAQLARNGLAPDHLIVTAGNPWIDFSEALALLTGRGEFSESQALIVMGHSLQRNISGATYYPRDYMEKRATDHANKPEPNAWDCR